MITVKVDPTAARRLRAIPLGLEKAVVASTMDLWSGAVAGTPVDTGFARASWWAALDSMGGHPSPPSPNPAPNSIPAPAVPAGAILASAGRSIFIANGAAYIRRLEYDGWSPQAPMGWIRVEAGKYPQHFKRHVAALLKGAK